MTRLTAAVLGALTALALVLVLAPKPPPGPVTVLGPPPTISELQRATPTAEVPGWLEARDVLDLLPGGEDLELVTVPSLILVTGEPPTSRWVNGVVFTKLPTRILVSGEAIAESSWDAARLVIHEWAHTQQFRPGRPFALPVWAEELYAYPDHKSWEGHADCLAEAITGLRGNYIDAGCTEQQLARAFEALGLKPFRVEFVPRVVRG